MSKYVEEQLKRLAQVHVEKGKEYGDNYKRVGYALDALCGPVGVVETPQDYNRLSLLNHIFSKLSRYCENFARGGHDDSLDDMAVYCMMLKELDQDTRGEKPIGKKLCFECKNYASNITLPCVNCKWINDDPRAEDHWVAK